ncbi:MAG: hypothetical protein JW934_11990 [Anaerolineae bacterium]|nr:hypothetical protein [Anaerolineae bacterium]
MSKRISFKKKLVQVVVPQLELLGYTWANLPRGWSGAGIFLLQKNLGDDIYGSVSFQLMRWHPPLSQETSLPRSFAVGLWRHIGMQPRYGYGNEASSHINWINNMPLSQLLWCVLDAKVYEWQYYEWKFYTSDELVAQLQDAVEKLVQYGIPWLENPESSEVQFSQSYPAGE